MSAELLEQLTDSLADQVIAKLGPKLIAFLEDRRTEKSDPLLTAKEAAAELGLSDNKVRELVALGLIKRAPGIVEIRIRKSELDAYGKANPSPARK